MQTDITWPQKIIYRSFDARSEYPYVMCTKKFPMKAFTLYEENVSTYEEIENLLNAGKCLLFELYLKNAKLKDHVTVPYIPISKCMELRNWIGDNGRVLRAELLSIEITDIDLSIIKEQYDYDSFAIRDLYISEYDYLPRPIRNHVLNGYYIKCGYEERGEKDSLYYGKEKNKLNGNFGMMYTDPVRDVIEVNEYVSDGVERWSTNHQEDVESALTKFYKSRNNFLCYQWGVWTTSHARRHHQNIIDAFADEFIYGDTDSAKGTDITGKVRERIEALNRKIEAECLETGAYYTKANGERLYMGVFVEEKPMKEFRTLGAKKYAYVDMDDELHVTISGVQKKNAKGVTSAQELGSIDKFKPGFIFTKCGGLEARYHDLNAPLTNTFYDERGRPHEVTYGSNVSLCESAYTLGITSDYESLLRMIGENI